MSKSGRFSGLGIHKSPCTYASRVQRITYGKHASFDGNARKAKWKCVPCKNCGGDVWIKQFIIDKGFGWTCPKCKAFSRKLGIEAALAVALRKKKMGIRW